VSHVVRFVQRPHAQHLRLTLPHAHVLAEGEVGQEGEVGGAAGVQQPSGVVVGKEEVQEGADGLEAADERMRRRTGSESGRGRRGGQREGRWSTIIERSRASRVDRLSHDGAPEAPPHDAQATERKTRVEVQVEMRTFTV
jgi:hypothetical protein